MKNDTNILCYKLNLQIFLGCSRNLSTYVPIVEETRNFRNNWFRSHQTFFRFLGFGNSKMKTTVASMLCIKQSKAYKTIFLSKGSKAIYIRIIRFSSMIFYKVLYNILQ
jgi:hypothetical protein